MAVELGVTGEGKTWLLARLLTNYRNAEFGNCNPPLVQSGTVTPISLKLTHSNSAVIQDVTF